MAITRLEIWKMRFAWLPTKTIAGNWVWLNNYMELQ